MRYLGLFAVLPFLFLLDHAVALGARGAAEKTLYWYTYLCEAALTPDNERYTTAPDCPKYMNGGKSPCNLNEFLHYIWAPNPNNPTEERPNYEVKLKADSSELTVEYVHGIIGRSPFRDFADPMKVNGEVDYYSSLAKVGQTIAKVQKKLDQYAIKPTRSDYPNQNDYDAAIKRWEGQVEQKKKYEKLVALAKDAARANYMLRFMDLENFRIKQGLLASPEYLGKVPVTKTVGTDYDFPEPFETLDGPATRKKYQSIQNFARDLGIACRKYRQDDADHFKALAAAASAFRGCKCDIPEAFGAL